MRAVRNRARPRGEDEAPKRASPVFDFTVSMRIYPQDSLSHTLESLYPPAWSSSRWFIYRGSCHFVDNARVHGTHELQFCKSSTRCWRVLCSSSSCVRLSKHELPKPTSSTCSCRGRRRPAAGVARRAQRRQWSRRERAADGAT